jgi:hypothetical protein
MTRFSAMCALGALSISMAVAAPQTKDTDKTKAMKCPVCHMDLTAKKDKSHTKAVKMGKKTLYCCAQCDMSKKTK